MAEVEAAGDESGNNYSVIRACLSCKLFALDLAAILRANLGILQEKQISQSTFCNGEMGSCGKIPEAAGVASRSRWRAGNMRLSILLRMSSSWV